MMLHLKKENVYQIMDKSRGYIDYGVVLKDGDMQSFMEYDNRLRIQLIDKIWC